MAYCSNCGKEVPLGALFCHMCGFKLGTTAPVLLPGRRGTIGPHPIWQGITGALFIIIGVMVIASLPGQFGLIAVPILLIGLVSLGLSLAGKTIPFQQIQFEEQRIELDNTPKSFLRNCINCGAEIPIASEKCYKRGSALTRT